MRGALDPLPEPASLLIVKSQPVDIEEAPLFIWPLCREIDAFSVASSPPLLKPLVHMGTVAKNGFAADVMCPDDSTVLSSLA